MDRTPKKPCKNCGLMGHFSYACYQNPKRALRALKRSPIKKVGKHTKQWYVTRATWIRKNPPPIEGTYWMCYLQIHPWCPGRIDIAHLTLDHVISRTRDPSQRFNLTNLKPACLFCNEKKGSRRVEDFETPDV